MPKPLFRFTLGNCIQQGLDVFAESIKKTTKALGENTFDWMVCYNGLSEEALDFVKNAIKDRPIELYEQTWRDCPINDEMQSIVREDGTVEWHGEKCGGTLWKVCPPRLRINAHEIIMDNDIIILKRLPQITQFLNTSKVLILEEPIRFYGRYDELFGAGSPFLNSGLMGMPPGYDFAKDIKKNWERNGSLSKLSQADEQGLLTFTLSRYPSVRISKEDVIELLARDFKQRITGDEFAIHFTQANRIPSHRHWKDYQNLT